MTEWTPEFEMAYWTAHPDEFYHQRVREKWDRFVLGPHPIETAVDIGGGKLGGALGLVPQAKRRILLDALADRFGPFLPPGIEAVTCDFSMLPLPSQSVDVVFAWNVYDHARDWDHARRGIEEAMRILRPGGLFLGTFPLREYPCAGHPVCLTEASILNALACLAARRTFAVREPHSTIAVLFVGGVR